MKRLPLGTFGRATLLSAVVLGAAAVGTGCLDRPVAPATPRTSNAITAQVSIQAVDKIDLLFAIDNSSSMADKQAVLALAVPDLVSRLVNPVCVDTMGNPTSQPMSPSDPCPTGTAREFNALKDIHIGVVSSSIGSGGANSCVWDSTQPASATNNPTRADNGHLIHRVQLQQQPNQDFSYPQQIDTYKGCPPGTTSPSCQTFDTGFLAWDPGDGKGGNFRNDPPGTGDVSMLEATFTQIVLGVDQTGCGYEAQMEGWYRFLIDPTPPQDVTVSSLGQPAQVSGVDQVVLQERTEFLRPDSLVAIVLVSDEDEHSFIVGALPNLPKCTKDTPANTPCWPDSYQVQNNYDASGSQPFGYNYLNLEYGGNFKMMSGTSACATDPYSPNCHECFTNMSGDGCHALSDAEDGLDLRQWNPKQRFGWDPQTPMQKYVDALTQQQIINFNDGSFAQNPLFDDLQFNAAQNNKTPLKRGKFQPRNPNLVFLATIVGVPWQDIARVNQMGKPDLSLGYMTASDLNVKHPVAGVVGWDLILGNPYDPNMATRTQPVDPLMIDAQTDAMHPRFPEGTKHPVTGEPLGYNQPWNSINGHEWNTGTNDLSYACIFPLPPSNPGDKIGTKLCTDPSQCDCNMPIDPMTNMPSVDLLKATDNPLCEPPSPSDPSVGTGQNTITPGMAGGTQVGVQYRAKAYPGKRYLEIQKRLANAGGNAIIASICAKNLTDNTAPDFGYRPAVSAIVEQLKDKLRGQCLPRQIPVDPTDGSSPCVILAAKYAKGDPTATSAEVADCSKCADTARAPVPSDIRGNLVGDVLNFQCLCEIPQFTGTKQGQDLYICKSDPGATTLPDGKGGWCYVDPKAPNQPAGGDQIVKACPANEKQTIRFLDANVNDTTLFITCLGAAAGSQPFTPSQGAGGAGGATGAAGSAGM